MANLRAAYGAMGANSPGARNWCGPSRRRARSSPGCGSGTRWPGAPLDLVLIHPELGPIELDCQVLFTEDQSQALLVLTAPPHTEGYEKLQLLLAVLGHERFARADHG